MRARVAEFRSRVSRLRPKTGRYLLEYIKTVEAEREDRVPELRMQLTKELLVRKAIRAEVKKLDRPSKARVFDYAHYLEECQKDRSRRGIAPTVKKVCWWSPTPRSVVIEALKLAEVGANDIVFDLGCGDGRVVVEAARLFGAQAVGFDVDPKRVHEARLKIQKARVRNRAQIRQQSILAIPDLYKATVVYLYLTPKALNQVIPLLVQRCRPGTRVVSVDTSNRHWPAEKVLSLQGWSYQWRVGLWYI
jgi:SAM-dependent methyltransferase